MVKKKRNTTIRFGARYGRTVRSRVNSIEVDLRNKHMCSKCSSKSVKRVSVGVWKCNKCGLVFSGGAYTPQTKLATLSKRSARNPQLNLT